MKFVFEVLFIFVYTYTFLGMEGFLGVGACFRSFGEVFFVLVLD